MLAVQQFEGSPIRVTCRGPSRLRRVVGTLHWSVAEEKKFFVQPKTRPLANLTPEWQLASQ